MKREAGFAAPYWDEPFWHALRMIIDQLSRRRSEADSLSAMELHGLLRDLDTPASEALLRYLDVHTDILENLSSYWSRRADIASDCVKLMRTQEQAESDYLSARLADGTEWVNGSRIVNETVRKLTIRESEVAGIPAEVDLASRAAMVSDRHIWVSPRRLDGGLPSMLNPVALWRVNEFWGRFHGSKMSDAIYDANLTGLELREFEEKFNIHVNFYLFVDGMESWNQRRGDVRRMVDLLYMGLVDELIIGSEVLTEFPRILGDNIALAKRAESV